MMIGIAGSADGAGTPESRRSERADTDAVIEAIAARQHGVVARHQLLAAGITEGRVEGRVMRRRLATIHRGVYRVGPLPMPRSWEMAAVLICGDSARLCQRTAATAMQLLDGAPSRADQPLVHVVATCNRRVPSWIRLYRVRRLPSDEAMVHDGIPITTPARTLLDIAAGGVSADMEHALLEALRRRLVQPADLCQLIERYPRRRGSRLLQEMLARAQNPELTRSEAERRLRDLIRSADLPKPRWNIGVAGYQVDCFWPAARLVVEVDGFAIHASHAAFQRDRRRDADFAAAGIATIRFTWHQLTRKPFIVVARVAAALAIGQERIAIQQQ